MSKAIASWGWVRALCVVLVLAIVAVGSFLHFSGRHGAAKTTSPALPAATPARARIQASYAALPLAFEKNDGQTDSQVEYMARGDGYVLFLTGSDAVFSLSSRSTENTGAITRRGSVAAAKNPAKHNADSSAVVRMQLSGANSPAKISASGQLPGKSNYFFGNDPGKWHTDVPHYSRVSYQGVYPGIDLAFHGAQRQTEFDFVVAPGANPAPIGLHFTGATSLTTDNAGNLVIASAAGDIQLHKPVAYQEQNGVREAVDARFALKANHQVSFELGNYDRSRELVIDPTFSYVYSTYLGGSGDDTGQGIAIDSTGAAYVTGQTSSANFPGASSTALHDTASAFVTKIAADGSSLLYSVYVGGTGTGVDSAYGIAVDGSDNAFITGSTSSTNFPVTTGAYQTSLNGTHSNAFLTELGPSGTIVYSTYIGGTGTDLAFGIALGNSGKVFIGGRTTSTNFPISATHIQAYLTGSVSSGFVSELSPSGSGASDLVYSTYLGGSSGAGDFDGVNAVAADASGKVYVTGETFSTTFPTKNPFQAGCNSCTGGNFNAFVSVIDTTTNQFSYSTYLGGSTQDEGNAIAIDSSGNAYVTGGTTSSDFPTTSGSASFGGSTDVFVTKFNSTGSTLSYSILLGGSGLEAGAGIALDASNNAYITGQTSSSAFPTVSANQPTFGGGVSDAFVSEVSSSGSLVFSTFLGGTGQEDSANLGAIAVNSTGANIYVTGNTIATSGTNNFPVSSAEQSSPGGLTDAFVVKYTQGAAATFSLAATTLTPSSVNPGGSATSTVTVTAGGGFSGTVTLTCAVSGPAGAAHLPTCAAATATPGTPGTLTVNTTAASASLQHPANHPSSGMFYAMFLPIGGIALLGLGSKGTRRKKLFGFLLIGLVLIGFILMPACGGSSNNGGGGGSSGTTAGAYTITVNGTATGASQTGTAPALTLNVN